METEHSSAPDVLKALGDPVRWTIVRCMADQPELAGSVLDDVLSISRPTISYHLRILMQAGLVDVTKRGRNHYYTLRREVLHSVLGELNSLVPGLRLVSSDAPTTASTAESVAAVSELPAVLPTW